MAANLPALGTPRPYDTNIIKGTPTLQHINIGERTPLSPAMFTVLVMVLLYYSLSVLVLYYNSKEKEITEAGRLRRGQAITSQGIILMLAFLVMLVRIRLRVDYEASFDCCFQRVVQQPLQHEQPVLVQHQVYQFQTEHQFHRRLLLLWTMQ